MLLKSHQYSNFMVKYISKVFLKIPSDAFQEMLLRSIVVNDEIEWSLFSFKATLFMLCYACIAI